MNQFPSSHLPVGFLAAAFNDTTSSYKFLMMRSIFDLAVNNNRIGMNEIALRSISYAWYTIKFYKLSYGPSDSMGKWVEILGHKISKNNEVLISDQSYDKIYQVLKTLIEEENESNTMKSIIKDFKNFVPYRLLTPWFASELKGNPDSQKNKIIQILSQDDSRKPLYKLETCPDDLYIILNPEWQDYLTKNAAFLDGWWHWNFISFLQMRNPTVLALSNKLQPPKLREMNEVKKLFRDYFLANQLSPKCFYSNVSLTRVDHDHFLPWSFLGTDFLFNFVPCEGSINSSKSNAVPSKDYLKNLSIFQYDIFNWLQKKRR